jgi:hypothetical protein
MRWEGYVGLAKRREKHKCLLETAKGRTLGRPRCRWKDNIKMDLIEGVCGV